MSENGEPDDGMSDLFAPLGEASSADAVGLTRRELRERRAAEAAAAEQAAAEQGAAEQAAAEQGEQPDAETAPEAPLPAPESEPAAAPEKSEERIESSGHEERILPEPEPEPEPGPDPVAPIAPDWDPAPELRPVAAAPIPPSAPSAPSAPEWDPAPELGLESESPEPEPAPAPVSASAEASDAERAAEPEQSGAEPEQPAPAIPATVPVSYDEIVPEEAPQAPAVAGAFPMRLDPPPPGRRGRRSLRWLAWFIPVVLVLAALGGGAWYAWTHYEDKVREVLGLSVPDDYSGEGNGTPVVVTIEQGASGSDIALALEQAGVTMSWKAFNDLANRLAHSTDCASPDPTNGCWPVIQFGNYELQQRMSAQAALDALRDPANKITSNLMIPEGSTLPQVLDIISATTEIPLEELQAAAKDPGQFGAANPAKSLEGYLYPDTYQLDGKETATSILQRLVDETFDRLDALGVKPEDRHAFLTGASMVQKESGPIAGDAAKVARVFQNRLDKGMKLQSDATVAYGAGNTTSIWNTSAQLSDAKNLYNTYVHPGLPIGPIAAPGSVALEAWAHPAAGDWLFFVPVNLKTGETHFSVTDAEHERYVQQLVKWCEASPENKAYCR